MPSIVNNESIHVSNMDTINLFYSSLKEALKSPDEVKVYTPAGQFVFSRLMAPALFKILEGLDRADNLDGEVDGQIADQAYQTIKKEYRKARGRPSQFGLSIPFRLFIPAKQWQENHKFITRFADAKRVMQYTSPRCAAVATDRLWEVTTLATLSGLSPEVFGVGEGLCNLERGCHLYLGRFDYGGATMRSYNTLGADRSSLGIVWNMSATCTAESVRASMVHEYGHRVCRLLTRRAGKQNFMYVVVDWGAKREGFGKKVLAFGNLYSTYNKKARDGLRYYFEESINPFAVGRLDKAAFAYRKKVAEQEMKKAAQLSNHDFLTSAAGSTDEHKSIAFLAQRIYRARAYDVNEKLIKRYKKKALTVIKNYGPEYVREYKAICGMLDVYAAYAQKSREFKRVAKEIAAKIR